MDERGSEIDDRESNATSRVPRACDSCRARKIRCDRDSPCSNCRASKLACQTTSPTQKVSRQRINISDEYERKIDRIEDRLAGIENVLSTLASKLGKLDITSTERLSPPDGLDSNRLSVAETPGTDPRESPGKIFEGETTMNTHSEFAQGLLERAIVSTPSMQHNAEIKAALASLQTIVSKQSLPTENESKLFGRMSPDSSSAAMERVPWEMIEQILDRAAESPTLVFTLVFPFLTFEKFREYCKEVYWGTTCTQGRKILTHGVLYNLFYEFTSFPFHVIPVDVYRPYAAMCRRNLEAALSGLNLLMPATFENILALVIASSYAVEICRPSLCWAFSTTAAGMCQSLGYHRLSALKDDSEDDRNTKMHAFWFIYTMDKNLSLRLGRASTIQDWDISIPYPLLISDGPVKGEGLASYWVHLARIQGQTYEQLFSPAAFLKSEAERVEIATRLVSSLNESLVFRQKALEAFPGKLGEFGEIFYRADEVVHYSVMTLIQRAIQPGPDSISSTFNNECIESARAALMSHQACAERFDYKGNEQFYSGYVHWSILQAPFTPFMVIFCHVITAYDLTDLQRLANFVASLESTRSMSDGADKLYRLCHVFYQVAKLYTEAKVMEKQANQGLIANYGEMPLDPSSIEQFDPYLSALGMVPNSAWPMATFPTVAYEEGLAPDGATLGNGNTMQDWFSGSRYIMGLLEEDLNMLG